MRRNYEVRDLEKYRYPNLVAEYAESGYSVCTLSDHMGHGRCEEDDTFIRGKLFGKDEINDEEASGLCGLFGCRLDYLLSRDLISISGKPLAYFRHHADNVHLDEDIRFCRIMEKIHDALKEKQYLVKAVEILLTMTEEQVAEVLETA